MCHRKKPKPDERCAEGIARATGIATAMMRSDWVIPTSGEMLIPRVQLAALIGHLHEANNALVDTVRFQLKEHPAP